MKYLRIALPLFLLSSLIVVACGPSSTSPTPTVDAAAIFAQNCSPCHGVNREGNVAPALTADALQTRGRTDQYIKDTITNGRGGMPSWQGKLTPAQIDALVKFLKT